VFGFSISGGRRLDTFVRQHDVGPALLTGGAYGPEGGLIGFGASILIAILVVAWLVFERHRRDRDAEERTGRGRKLAES
jgi:hypothetical protein